MSEFVPAPVYVVNAAEQIKAFGDPLRTRVLGLLCQREATNQQIADELGEPQAKVLYHIRFLLDVGLIQQVDTRVKGGNVEKYYRAIAYIFDLRPPAEQPTDDTVALTETVLHNLRQRVIASVIQTTNDEATGVYMHTGWAYMTQERMDEFNERLKALMLEFCPPGTTPSPDTLKIRFAGFIYKDMGEK
jgi:DNA-binding transcriptional ArsR family regulator